LKNLFGGIPKSPFPNQNQFSPDLGLVSAIFCFLKSEGGKGDFTIDTQAKISYIPPPKKSFYRITEKGP
jgi:hypothetical protein